MSSPRKYTNLFSEQTLKSSHGMKSAPVIDEDWINALQKKINDIYPDMVMKYPRQKYDYPTKGVGHANISNTKKNDMYLRYNPFHLRLPHELESDESFYERNKIRQDRFCDRSDRNWITVVDASVTYLNFIEQYNLAYITFLRAINGSEQALLQLKDLFTSEKMYSDAGVLKVHLHKDANKGLFISGVLAYVTLNIVFSKEDNISTGARIKALEILSTNFDIEKISEAFSCYQTGYSLKNIEDEPVYDMIPKRFVTSANESGGTPHNQIFLENIKIKEMFNIRWRKLTNLDGGISTLLNKHPSEMLQVLNGLLRYDSLLREEIKYIFTSIVSLSKLDNIQKGEIFGTKASYRNNGESQRSLETRVGWVMGSENFGDFVNEDELNHLSNEELKVRVRQATFRIYQLEAELVEAGRHSVLEAVSDQNDPNGYFATLLLHPDTPEEHFEELLKRNYRVLALKLHPDKPNGDAEKFKKLQEAYEVLLDVESRNRYRAAGNKSAYRKPF